MSRVLVVDNDVAVINLLVLDLDLEGHEVLATALDGDEAVRLCDDLRPEVLVIDLRLGPGLDGLEVAGQVRKPGLRIVLHTNYVNREVLQRARSLDVVVVEKGNLNALRRAVASDA